MLTVPVTMDAPVLRSVADPAGEAFRRNTAEHAGLPRQVTVYEVGRPTPSRVRLSPAESEE
jgi:hypothetical protein